jgi:D-tyrosyl-tRNA(Tyr) deacylase
MRIVLQRVNRASVTVEDEVVGSIGFGLLLFVGIGEGDQAALNGLMVDRVAGMRIFSDEQGKFRHSVLDRQGSVLVISQFTLFGDPWSGRRPDFRGAASAEVAEEIFNEFVDGLRRAGVKEVQTGRFGKHMVVTAENDGPVTIILDSADHGEGKT